MPGITPYRQDARKLFEMIIRKISHTITERVSLHRCGYKAIAGWVVASLINFIKRKYSERIELVYALTLPYRWIVT
jgi:hypothetical protein